MANNRYSKIIEYIFFTHFKQGDTSFQFNRTEFSEAGLHLGIEVPLNVGDIPYSFRFRNSLPASISSLAPEGKEWLIALSGGKGMYRFYLAPILTIVPNTNLVQTKILEATPAIISRYALNDEQALLAILRYNRLIDIFLGLTCYSLQNHLRTFVPGIGQIETDEIYVGVNTKGSHFVIPVQAKGGKDKQGAVQIEQDFELAKFKFPSTICLPVAAQFMDTNKIAMFAFEQTDLGLKISSEKHYHLVRLDQLSNQEILSYQPRPV